MADAQNKRVGQFIIMEEKFTVRTYGFQELASLYLPNIQARSASIQLSKWISRNPQLSKRLVELGYRKGIRLLTPNMVSVILEVLGEP